MSSSSATTLDRHDIDMPTLDAALASRGWRRHNATTAAEQAQQHVNGCQIIYLTRTGPEAPIIGILQVDHARQSSSSPTSLNFEVLIDHHDAATELAECLWCRFNYAIKVTPVRNLWS